MADSPFLEFSGPLTRDELHQLLTDHPELFPMGGEHDVAGHLLVAFVLRNTDRRLLALFFGPVTGDPARWMLIGWLPVPKVNARSHSRASHHQHEASTSP
jgi:hypothetical protein